MKTDPTFWILARASGLTAYLLLTASIMAGLVLKARPFRSLKPAQVTDIHRFLALLGKDSKLDPASLDVEHGIGNVALLEHVSRTNRAN